MFNVNTLVWTRKIFPVKHITHVVIAKPYTSMKARDVSLGGTLNPTRFMFSIESLNHTLGLPYIRECYDIAAILNNTLPKCLSDRY